MLVEQWNYGGGGGENDRIVVVEQYNGDDGQVEVTLQ